MPPVTSDYSDWFSEHVHPHEPMLRAWLLSRFPSGCDIDDIVQEAFVRVLNAREKAELRAPKAFLFATARNLALDWVRRQKLIASEALVEIEALSVLDDAESIPESLARNQELEFLTEAIQSLPARCRQIFTLRKIYGLSQKEIADQLGISEHTVSAQLTIGVHKCSEYFARHYRKDGPRHE